MIMKFWNYKYKYFNFNWIKITQKFLIKSKKLNPSQEDSNQTSDFPWSDRQFSQAVWIYSM